VRHHSSCSSSLAGAGGGCAPGDPIVASVQTKDGAVLATATAGWTTGVAPYFGSPRQQERMPQIVQSTSSVCGGRSDSCRAACVGSAAFGASGSRAGVSLEVMR
jgi:hypothetical protein